MVLGSQLAPQNVELRAYTNVFPDFVYFLDASVVNDDFQVRFFIRTDDSSQDIDQSGFSGTIVPQNAHEFIWLNFQVKVFYCLHFLFGEQFSESFAQALYSQTQSRNVCCCVPEHSVSLFNR